MDFGRFSMMKGAKRRANQFSYRSRFYSEKKEKLDKRIKELDAELEDRKRASEEGRPTKKSFDFNRIENNHELRRSYKQQAGQSNLVIIALVIILCFIGYFVLQNFQSANV